MALVASPDIQEVEGRRTRLLANAKGVETSGVRQAGPVGFRARRPPSIANTRLCRLLPWRPLPRTTSTVSEETA
jgi:hypothetical protein